MTKIKITDIRLNKEKIVNSIEEASKFLYNKGSIKTEKSACKSIRKSAGHN